jgi:hypothetical protein
MNKSGGSVRNMCMCDLVRRMCDFRRNATMPAGLCPRMRMKT